MSYCRDCLKPCDIIRTWHADFSACCTGDVLPGAPPSPCPEMAAVMECRTGADLTALERILVNVHVDHCSQCCEYYAWPERHGIEPTIVAVLGGVVPADEPVVVQRS